MALRERPQEGWVARVERVLHEVSPVSAGTCLLPPTLDAVQLQQLSRYLDLVLTWNQRYDLTAARGADELVDLFMADAVALASVELRDDQPGRQRRWVDVGSGAGAPGLPLSVLCPVEMSLIEPRAKRVAFLRTVVGTLRLRSVSVVRARVDQLEDEGFDVAVSRATLPPEAWLAEGARIAPSVWLLLAQAEPPRLPGWQADFDVSYRWPLTGVARRAVRFRRPSA